MLIMQLTKISKWLSAIISTAVALAAVAILGIVGYKLIGAAGALGVAILIIGLAVNAFMIKTEDMSDGIDRPGSSKHKK